VCAMRVPRPFFATTYLRHTFAMSFITKDRHLLRSGAMGTPKPIEVGTKGIAKAKRKHSYVLDNAWVSYDQCFALTVAYGLIGR
jgi:hypothetical protein